MKIIHRLVTGKGVYRRQEIIASNMKRIGIKKWMFGHAPKRRKVERFMDEDKWTERNGTHEKCLLCSNSIRYVSEQGRVDHREALLHRISCEKYQ